MTKITITQLIWDEWNKEHIKKHKVTIVEVEEAIQQVQAHRKGYAGRVALIGRSGKRILAILIAPQNNKLYYIVTVRDADRKERKLIYENEKK